MALQNEFEQAVRDHFIGLTERVDAALARILRELPPATRCLMFEYDSPSFARGFAVFSFPVLPGGAVGKPRRLLDDGSVVVPPAIYEADRFEAVEPWDVASDLLETWVAERWASLSGPLPAAFIAHHDSYMKTNLADGTRVTADEVARLFAQPG